MKQHFAMMADYNRWANARIYNATAGLADELFKRPVGVYFKTLHGTLNHLLAADRIWMHRLDGTGTHPDRLDAILFEEFGPLRTAREVEDLRIIQYVRGLAGGDLEKPWEYRTLEGARKQQRLRDILAHLFNHQTHHRGQAHAALTALGVREPESLDLVVMQRQLK
jgi:uncharacterized damage-inducible protein DinB